MNLTIEDIEADIQEFEQRILSAGDKLAALPKGRLPSKQHKKVEKQRQHLRAEIEHVQKMMTYAFEALKEALQ